MGNPKIKSGSIYQLVVNGTIVSPVATVKIVELVIDKDFDAVLIEFAALFTVPIFDEVHPINH